ncbi:MAG: hypothetical protein N3A72_06410 [bacterium]|nr:hypothetical protein [bacterium]
MSLNENQKRSVRVTLLLLEKSLDEIDRLLREKGHVGILYRIHQTIPEEQSKIIGKAVRQIREEIKMVKDTFHLEVAQEDIRNKLRGILGIDWENLEDIKSDKLRGYGKVEPILRNTLDPHIDRIIRLIMNDIYPIIH